MQLLGHGIDIVEVARIRELLERHGTRFEQRCFTADELAYSKRRPKRAAEHLAARFAAKEATLKAIGTGRRHGINWTDVEVVREPTGRPALQLSGEAEQIAARIGISTWSLSLSHVTTHATASAVAMGRPPLAMWDEQTLEQRADERADYERLHRGMTYRMGDPLMGDLIDTAKRLAERYNMTSNDDVAEREALLQQLFGSVGERPAVLPPFHCDYGRHIHVGDRFFANHGCVFLDCATIRFGDDCFLGPHVQIYTPHHPIDPTRRAERYETAHPVTVGDRVWIGGNAVILPGVTIGSDTTIGAGSVVTKDIPAGVVAVGNPCRVIREKLDEDRRTRL
ncbi:MAG: holo-ACP synthase [Planctomycetota bacterium]